VSWEVFAQVLGSLSSAKSAFDPESTGGGGGGVSAKTQGGGTQLEYIPVGLETLEIPNFDYAFLDQIYQDEEAQQDQQQMKYGGPLYAADGKPLTDIEAQRQAIIQKFIGERPPEMVQYSYASEPTGIETLIEDEVVPEITVEGIEPKISLEEIKADLDNMLAEQKKKDTFDTIMDSFNAISAAKKAFDPEKTGSIKGRGNVVPGAAAGGFRSKPNKLALETRGINPFEYKAMKGGGKVLDRGMFAQNYMPNGGALRGPGGPKDDLIPVMASNGEYMLSKAAVDQAGGGNHSKGIAKLEAFNNLGNRRYG